MDNSDRITWLLLGLIVGLFAMFVIYRTFPRKIEGWIVALLVGIAGSWVGGWLADLIGVQTVSWIGSIVVAFVGACLILWLLRRALPGTP